MFWHNLNVTSSWDVAFGRNNSVFNLYICSASGHIRKWGKQDIFIFLTSQIENKTKFSAQHFLCYIIRKFLHDFHTGYYISSLFKTLSFQCFWMDINQFINIIADTTIRTRGAIHCIARSQGYLQHKAPLKEKRPLLTYA